MKALLIGLLVFPVPASAACGVALALIVDVSGSINEAEFDLQMQGLADALLDPTVRDAMIAEQAALTLIEWSATGQQAVIAPWTQMTGDGALIEFAGQVRAAKREWRASFTAVGAALRFAGEYFAVAPACERKVIDISGDGPGNDGPRAWVVRDELVAQGFIINGIAIEGAIVSITEYYQANVIGGFGSFVLTATDYEDYPRAIKRKLINEVTRPGS